MATPKTVTDASSDLDEAVLNNFLRAGKLQVKANYLSLTFTASTNVVTVTSGVDSDGEVVDGDLAWNAGAVRVDITLTGFTASPVTLATIRSNASTNVEKLFAVGFSSTEARLTFVTNTTPGAAVDPDGDMVVNLLIIGV